jgi:hypothetical protein
MRRARPCPRWRDCYLAATLVRLAQGGTRAMGDMIVERLKEQDDVPGWDDPDDAHLFG